MKADSSNSARKKYMTKLRDNYLKKIAHSPKQIVPFIIIALVSVFMELSIFNIKHWATAPLSNSVITLSSTSSDVPSGSKLTFGSLNDSVDSIALTLEGLSDNDVAHVTYMLTDSGSSQEAYELPTVDISTNIPSSRFSRLKPYGLLKSIVIRITTDSGSPVTVASVTLNEQCPFTFHMPRVLLCFIFLLFIWAFRPTGSLWKRRVSDWNSPIIVLSAAVVIMVVLATQASIKYHSDDKNREWYNDFAFNEYTELARAFAKGRLYVDEEPPSWLSEMDTLHSQDRLTGTNNVYDYSVRAIREKETGESYKRDIAYFNGHYYVYFGATPVIIAYLPYLLITGRDLGNSTVCGACLALMEIGMFLLLARLCRMRYRHVSLAALFLCYVSLVITSGIVYTCARPSFYNVPVSFALTLAVWGLYFLLRGYTSERHGNIWYVLGSACLSLIAGCRPQLLVFGLTLVLVTIAELKHHDLRKDRLILAQTVGCVWIPVLIVSITIMWYNYVRFGSPLDFGANYNLTGNSDMTLRGFDPTRMVEGVFYYLCGSIHTSTTFPFVNVQDFSSSTLTFMGKNITEPYMGGLISLFPICILIPMYLIGQRKNTESWRLVLILSSLGVVICAFDTEVGAIYGRYQQDFGILFGLACVICVFGLEESGLLSSFIKSGILVLITASAIVCLFTRLGLTLPAAGPSGCCISSKNFQYLKTLFQFWV